MRKRGPGKAHRRGLSLAQLFDLFPDEESARIWFEKQLWPHGPVCPLCGAQDRVKATPNQKPLPYWCGDCRRHFSVRMGTALERSRVSLRKWAIAIYLENTSLKGVSSMKLHRDLNVSQKTAWFMLHRIREAWAHDSQQKLAGPAEADETYFGGLKKNRPKHRRELWGRGKAGKTPVIALLDRKKKRVVAQVLPNSRVATIEKFVRSSLRDGATLYTDEGTGYRELWDFDHHTVNHSHLEYVRGPVHTNSLESFWSMLKRAHMGTFHKLSVKHLHRYVNEFAGRYNMRDLDTHQQMRMTAHGLIGRRLTYEALTTDYGREPARTGLSA